MVIEGASVSVKTMSDGTLRLSIDIEPRNAQAAFALFGAPGRAVALAALKDGAAAKSAEPPRPSAEVKGGQWAKLAGMWCADHDFWAFLTQQFGEYIETSEQATRCIRERCAIQSRVELDNFPDALKKFNVNIRYPFMKYMQARGISK